MATPEMRDKTYLFMANDEIEREEPDDVLVKWLVSNVQASQLKG